MTVLRPSGDTLAMIPVYSPVEVDRQVDIMASIQRVYERHRYILDVEVERFEEAFAAYCGVGQCVGVANGTDALELALRAVDVGLGDGVALVANAGPYGSSAVRAIGAVPLYVDIDPISRTMSPGALAASLNAQPKAAVVTHLYGRLADMAALSEIAHRAKLPLIEDCAQAHGAMRDGKRAGSFGALGCFSFYPTKNLPAIGDAGAVVTDDAQLARRVRWLARYGWEEKYHVAHAGGRNSRLDELQAAVLNDRLPYLDEWNRQRRSIAAAYQAGLAATAVSFRASSGPDYVAHIVAVEVADRDVFRGALAERQIGTDVHYPLPDHRQTANVAAEQPVSLPHTEATCARVVSLPCFPGMTKRQVETVLKAIAEQALAGA
jgi:dTDP-4-amino-4,6-dideoxygalactose transaminase